MVRWVEVRRFAVLIVAMVVWAPAAHADEHPQLDLQSNLTLDGTDTSQGLTSTERVGDVNGDGRDDLVVADSGDQTNRGVAYVVFSPAAGTPGGDPTRGSTRTLTDLTDPGGAAEGFRVEGKTGDSLASDVAAGDIDGDGRSDLVLAAPSSRRVYVVFGKADDAPVHTDALGASGYAIDHAATSDGGGVFLDVATLPDVNGDGRDEVVHGDSFGDRLPGGTSSENSGSAFVTFGKAGGATIDIDTLGTAGFELRGAAGMKVGRQPVAVPDMNGDGKAELLIAAPEFDSDTTTAGIEGAVFVVFGGNVAAGAVFDLSSLDGGAADPGFRVTGPRRQQVNSQAKLGEETAAGDLNGDGRGDLVLTARTWRATNTNTSGRNGAVFVVYGRPGSATVPTDQSAPGSLGPDGYRIDGPKDDAFLGTSTDVLPDVNGDGRPELLIGGETVDTGSPDLGGVAIVYGRTGTANLSLASLAPADGQVLIGTVNSASFDERAGTGGVAGGDFNDDGYPDVVVNAPDADHTSPGNHTGTTYTVLGTPPEASVDLAAPPAGKASRLDADSGSCPSGLAPDLAGHGLAHGDFDGDGHRDLVVADPGASTAGRSANGAVWVILDDAGLPSFSLCGLGSRGYRIDGVATGDNLGDDTDAVAVGNVNGDGKDDLVLGAPDVAGGSGQAYVVFGGVAAGTTVDLATFPQASNPQGYRIDADPAIAAHESLGSGVAVLGDANGDGRGEVAVGAPVVNTVNGRVYVIPGKASGTTEALPGAASWTIEGAINDALGLRLGAVGDLNSDGIGELLAPMSGGTWVLFGRPGPSTTNLTGSLSATSGFKIAKGALANIGFGGPTFGIPSVIGDARPDIVLTGSDVGGSGRGGVAVIVAGRSSALTFPRQSSEFLRIDAHEGDDVLTAQALGDVSGDGVGDLAVGSAKSSPRGRAGAGTTYVVHLKNHTHPIDLERLGIEGRRYDGAVAGDNAGAAVGAPGDLTGDGRADLAVGAPGTSQQGSVHLLDGRTSDGVAPQTRITAGPSGSLPTGEVSVQFTADEPGSTFECKVDGGAFAGCTSPHTLSPGEGAHTFAVRATDVAGNTDPTPATRAFTLVGSAPEPPPGPDRGPTPDPTGPAPTPAPAPAPGEGGSGVAPDRVAPRLTAVALSPSRFRVGSAATPSIAAFRRGSVLTYRLSEAATVTITVERLQPGRRSGRRCVAGRRAGKRCTRVTNAGVLRRTSKAGPSRIPFSGRIGRKALAVGGYRLKVVARDAAGNASRPVTVAMRIVRR